MSSQICLGHAKFPESINERSVFNGNVGINTQNNLIAHADPSFKFCCQILIKQFDWFRINYILFLSKILNVLFMNSVGFQTCIWTVGRYRLDVLTSFSFHTGPATSSKASGISVLITYGGSVTLGDGPGGSCPLNVGMSITLIQVVDNIRLASRDCSDLTVMETVSPRYLKRIQIMLSKKGSIGSRTSSCGNIGFGFVAAKIMRLGTDILKGDQHGIIRLAEWKLVSEFLHLKICTVNFIGSWRGFCCRGNGRNFRGDQW